ncbi:MAG TPA: hypothetical protein PLF87_05640 [Syntrophorhabdaceae bacterium]|jgi:regulator of replication initiation timing|nr:hypothetical protein [Syntrophorhabdaceae bacterium]OQC51458.1 MAG: hypothetical protein BWX58_00248 [Deltaproteobacteria bacterium ADurb.Bin026]HOF57993.1 hypothetical protein [Syntrophorhabdaceae bacterium]HOS05486.1 hypothetical protein [Syntrophorhabdaceae bacterium]HPL41310.1 hypothetical protein [Syntrophorhabdaceae bacterium]
MRKIVIYLSCLLFVFGFVSCNKEAKNLKEEIRLLKEENSFLKAENIGLKKELEELYKKIEEKASASVKTTVPETKEVQKPKNSVKSEEGLKKKNR